MHVWLTFYQTRANTLVECRLEQTPTAIQTRSGDTLLVDHGSLYPALQRLEQRGWIKGVWGTSDNNRRARFYSLTATGRKQFTVETGRWNRLVESIARVMEPGPTPEKA
jgi:PadR family transcriptional regulator PadR